MRRLRLAAGLAACLAALLFASYPLRSDTMKLSTYYPAPSGVYKKIITTAQTVLARDTGRVNIGSLEGSQKLNVHNATSQGGIGISGPSDNGLTYSALYLHDETSDRNNTWVVAHKKMEGTPSKDSFHIGRWVTDDDSFTALAIQPSGNVGIGTADPKHRLHVYGRIHAQEDICTESGGLKCLSSSTSGGGGGGWKSVNLAGTEKYNPHCAYRFVWPTLVEGLGWISEGMDADVVQPQQIMHYYSQAEATIIRFDKKTKTASGTSVNAIYESCPAGQTGIGQ